MLKRFTLASVFLLFFISPAHATPDKDLKDWTEQDILSVNASLQSALRHRIELAKLEASNEQGVDYLDPNEPVMPVDLLDAEESQCVKIEEGDILLVRTGNYKMRLDNPPAEAGEPMTACQVACTPLFKERGVAMLGTDTSNDFRPSHYSTIGSPLHTMCLVTLGLWLIDNANLEELAKACAERNRYEFMLTLAPLRLRNVTGSPVSPIALF